MNNPKILLILLLLLALLFVVGINLGAAHNDDQTYQTPSWTTGLGNVLVRNQPLALNDLTATPSACLQAGKLSIPSGKSCVYAIHQAPLTLRQISLQLVQDADVTLKLTQEEILPLQQTLQKAGETTSKDMKVYPGKAHGVLSIACVAPQGVPSCLLMPTTR